MGIGPATSAARLRNAIVIEGAPCPSLASILCPAALEFVATLTREFRPRLLSLLEARQIAAARRDAGERLDFLPETNWIRQSNWRVAPIPRDLRSRVVEITGPLDRKMVINALNSGADVFMADCEDATSPTFVNLVEGQRNLFDAVRGTIEWIDDARGKRYALAARVATLLVRPRGLHLVERHARLDGAPLPGCLFDFGLYLFHNARELRARGTGPYFYLPKLEHHLEARWWNDVFRRSEELLGLTSGTIKATILIETLPAAFQMDEILHELRERVVGLNCGRWDYIFSFIKCHRADAAAILPDRAAITMEQPFLRAYSQLLIKTCHRRGAFAIGGMAAQIPIKDDAAANAAALEKVRRDKRREASDGHDGTWVAHPGLVSLARETFRERFRGDHQLAVTRDDVAVVAEDLLALPRGVITEAGMRQNVRVGIQYLEAWLRGNGCVPLENLMEDAATAEISRAQLWQWLRHGARLEDDRLVDEVLLRRIVGDEMRRIANERGPAAFERGRFKEARDLFMELCLAKDLADFLTTPAYALLP